MVDEHPKTWISQPFFFFFYKCVFSLQKQNLFCKEAKKCLHFQDGLCSLESLVAIQHSMEGREAEWCALAKTKTRRLCLCCKTHTHINTQVKAHRQSKQMQGHSLTCMFSKTTLNSHDYHVRLLLINNSFPRAESTYLSKVKTRE